MPSIKSLEDCAEGHLRHYLSPAGPRAFQTYDRCSSPRSFDPVDAFAPGLLDATVKGRYVIEMFKEERTSDSEFNYSELRRCIQEVVESVVCRDGRFLEAPPEKNEAWQLVRKAFIASDSTPGIKAGIVSKMLHRKLPDLVPIYDSKVHKFYGISNRTPARYWDALYDDWYTNARLLMRWAQGRQTPDGRPLSILRVADIVIWEHMNGCPSPETSAD